MEDIVKDLLTIKWIDFNIVDNKGQTPLDIAFHKRLENPTSTAFYIILQVLRKHGAFSSTLSNEALIEASYIDPNMKNITETTGAETSEDIKKEI